VAPPIPAMHKAQPINQWVARMAIELPDPQAKTLIVAETPAPYQCCRAVGGCRRGGQPG